jgi:hypothetical protein
VRDVIGVARAAALAAASGHGPPDDVLVDPQRSGTYCLQSADQV